MSGVRELSSNWEAMSRWQKSILILLFGVGITINVASATSHFEHPETIRTLKASMAQVLLLHGVLTFFSEAFWWFLASKRAFEVQATAIIFGWFVTLFLIPSF